MANAVLLFLDRVKPVMQKAYKESANDADARARLDEIIDRLVAIEAAAILADLLGQAQLLNELSDVLEEAIRDVRGRIGNFLLPLGEIKSEIDRAAGWTNADIRLPSADEAAAGETPGASATPRKPPVAGSAAALFDNCRIRDDWIGAVDRVADRIVAHGERYRSIERSTRVPWWFIGILHSLENGNNFSGHLHNGDPLTARTVQVPKGRPETGMPPFSWEESAVDALSLKDLHRIQDWPLDVVLERMERYNGLGYRKRGLNSPYLWSGSQHYEKGKFVKDGVFDPAAVSKQVGGAVVLKRMVERGIVQLTGKAKQVSAAPAASLGRLGLVPAKALAVGAAETELAFTGPLEAGAKGNAGRQSKVRRLQEWLTLNGFSTPVDGEFGEATRTALTRFQASATLPADGEMDKETWLHLTAPMRRALAPLGAKPATFQAAAAAIAEQHLRARPMEVGGTNRGPWVRLYMDGRDGTEQEWCAGFVCFVVAQAARELGVAMPFPRQVGVDALVRDGEASGRFIAEKQLRSDPALRPSRIVPGTIFVLRSASNSRDWTHTGLVTAAGAESFESIEGNTSHPKVDARSIFVSRQQRGYDNKDFLRPI